MLFRLVVKQLFHLIKSIKMARRRLSERCQYCGECVRQTISACTSCGEMHLNRSFIKSKLINALNWRFGGFLSSLFIPILIILIASKDHEIMWLGFLVLFAIVLWGITGSLLTVNLDYDKENIYTLQRRYKFIRRKALVSWIISPLIGLMISTILYSQNTTEYQLVDYLVCQKRIANPKIEKTYNLQLMTIYIVENRGRKMTCFGYLNGFTLM